MPLPNVDSLITQYQEKYYGKTKRVLGSKYILFGYDVLNKEPKRIDISKPLNSIWFGRKNSGKSTGLFSWTDGHYYRGYVCNSFHDLHGEGAERYLPNPDYFEAVNEGAKVSNVSIDEFIPDDSTLEPFGWDKNHIKYYYPEFIGSGKGKPLSLNFTSLPREVWIDRLGYTVQNRVVRRAFEIIYDAIKALKSQNSEFHMDKGFIDDFYSNPAKYIGSEQLNKIPLQSLTDVLSAIEMDLVEKKIIEGEYTTNLFDVFSSEDDVVFDYSKLSLLSQLRKSDALDPRDIYVTVSICMFFEWVREMRESGDKTPYRASLDEMQRILTGYRAQGSLKQPMALQAIGLFVTQARKFGVGFDVALQSAITYVPKEVAQSFDLVCISDMPMDKGDKFYLMDTFREYRHELREDGFGQGRPFHFWVLDTVAEEVSLIVPYPNRSKKSKEKILSSLQLKSRRSAE